MVIDGIVVDFTRDNLFDVLGLTRLKEGYMRAEEKSPQERFAYVAKKFGSNLAHAQRLYEYSSRHWLSYSTPILSFDSKKKGLGISCYLNHISDTAKGLVDNLSETNWMSIFGGGVGVYFGIRSAGTKSTGVMAHMKTYDASCLAYRQDTTRRGSYAAYLDAVHPEIQNFVEMRKPTGDQNLRAMNMHHGINITDEFMELVEGRMLDKDFDDTWELKDPNNPTVKTTVKAHKLWIDILETRVETGEPYMHWIDESNRRLPHWLKARGLKVKQSNLCSEIILPTDDDRSAVCCLSSVNLEYFDEWKNDKQFLHDVAEMLDNVLQHFIDNAPDVISRARYSAERERSIGVGALGWHAYLQKNNIPFESAQAIGKNIQIFKHIRTDLDKANLALGLERGEAPDAEGTGFRFSHLMAIAPNASSSIIMGNTSPSVEPYKANIYRQDTISGWHTTKNKWLDRVLLSKGLTDEEYQETWSAIIADAGSVQNCKHLTDWEKDVFKTALELDQLWIIQHAGDRQEFIDQGQSINVFLRPDADIKYLHAIHFTAWKKKLKTLYYCRSQKVGEVDKISKKIARKIMKGLDVKALTTIDESTCLGCE